MTRTGPAVLAILLLAFLAVGCGGSGKPRFESAAGWERLSGQNELAAANVHFAAADRSLASPPSETVARLPRRGVVIWAMVSRSAGPGSTPLPLRLSEAVPSNPFEGFRCAPAVSESRCLAASGSIRHLEARVGRYFADLYVFFGTDRPATASLAAANAELARLRFPGEQPTAASAPACPTRSGTDTYATTLNPSAGPAGSTVTVSGPLGVMGKDGTYYGQTAHDVKAYWNLDFRKWWSALTPSPFASVRGSPVELLGKQVVAKLCRYELRVTIPSTPRGTYPIEVLAGEGKTRASFGPVSFRVTRGR
jgi:hypothetical protein